ncbi:hypothetical protein [Marinigracilibium pacificum]|uniref:Nitrogen fixation protein n=1 Tax=Marinigracilibium pacificum TaxID=2729599 RepID=A0A848J207_9BACT|nr:hypothetical protein [Marinigracilibium pacificum]NMM49826.1 hypothetical protein [Marinigracilibium pacificum]
MAKPGAKLFGIVNTNGFIDYLKATIEIDETFVEEAAKGRPPEQRFRFAGNCAKNGCKQWNGKKGACGLIDNIIEFNDNRDVKDLNPCAIRERCRWFAQRGARACSNCNDVIRNLETELLEIEGIK